MRSALRPSFSCAFAGSILVVAAACGDATAPEESSILAPDSPAFARGGKPKPPPVDNTPPTVPAFSVTSLGTRHIGLAWSSTDNSSQFISYQVYKDGVKVHTGWISETSRTFTLLQPGTTYTFTAQAKDRFVNESGGNLSAASPGFSVTTKVNDGSDVTPPTQPSSVQAFGYGDLEMQVWWNASTDAVTPQNVIVYEIYVNGVHENTAIGKNMTPSAYGVPGNNVVTVIAIDEAGNRSIAGQTTIVLP